MTGYRPILVLILNFIIGAAVTQGFVPLENKDQVIEMLADIVGYTIILMTSIAGVVHVLKKPHVTIPASPIIEQTKTIQSVPVSPSQEPNAGTPPPFPVNGIEQQPYPTNPPSPTIE